MPRTNKPAAPPVCTCACGRSFTAAEWKLLELVGRMDLDEDGDQRLELRNCPCRSTRAIELPPPPPSTGACMLSGIYSLSVGCAS